MASGISFAFFVVDSGSDDFFDGLGLAFEARGEGPLELVLDGFLISEATFSLEPLATPLDEFTVALQILGSLLAEVKLGVVVPMNLVRSPSYETGMLGAVVRLHDP